MGVGSFSAAITGLNAFSSWLGVIGNNLSNLNTVGFKSSSVSFQDLVSQSISGGGANPMQVGLGVATGSISPSFSQGAIESTRESSNCAIQGAGFFLVKGASGATAYTRAGNFSFNNDGVLVTADGSRVQGWSTPDPATGAITTTGLPGAIAVPPGVLRAPVATTTFNTVTNLGVGTAVGETFSSSVQVYDSLGTQHALTMTYTKTAANAWTYSVSAPGAEVVGGVAGTPAVLASGALTFDAQGVLASITPAGPSTGGGAAPNIANILFTTPAWTSGAGASALTFNLFDSAGKATLSGYTAPSATSSVTQNGGAAGMIESVSVMSDGTVLAQFGAGQTVAVAKLALANFNNPKGLIKLGSNQYGESQASGLANVGAAGTGGRGTLIGSAVEQSNVDIAQEFTSMILAQRGYQANSKTITVSDEMLLETLNLKR